MRNLVQKPTTSRRHLMGSPLLGVLTGLLGMFLFLFSLESAVGQAPGGPPSSEYPGSGYPEGYDGSGDSDTETEYESEMGYEYDGTAGGRPGGRRGGTANANDVMMQSYGSVMTSLLNTVDLNKLFAPDSQLAMIDAGPVLSVEAEHAYQSGNYPLALELFYGHMVTEYDQARVSLQTVNYSKLLRRPVWQTRFGVSFTVRGEIDADPQPVKEGKTAVRVAAGGGGGAGPDSYPEDRSADYEEDTGQDMEAMAASYPSGDGYGNQLPSSQSRKSTPQAVMLSAEANEQLDKYLGLVARIVAEEFEARYRQGDYGAILINVMPPEPVDRRRRQPGEAEVVVASQAPMSQEVMDALADSPEPRPLWRPGIMYYGEGESTDVVREAKLENVDVLLHFDIVLKPSRNEKYVQNLSRCRLIHVETGKSLGVSKGIDNFEAIRLAQKGLSDEREYVTGQLENLFLFLDRSVKTAPLPPLTAEIAKRRVGSLLASTSSNSLRTLAEIRLYQMQELITAEEAEAAFDILGGDEALLLLHAPLEERLKMARKWAVKSVPEFN